MSGSVPQLCCFSSCSGQTSLADTSECGRRRMNLSPCCKLVREKAKVSTCGGVYKGLQGGTCDTEESCSSKGSKTLAACYIYGRPRESACHARMSQNVARCGCAGIASASGPFSNCMPSKLYLTTGVRHGCGSVCNGETRVTRR